MGQPTVRHDPEGTRFHAATPAGLAYLRYRVSGPGTVEFLRTYVPPADREQGVGEAIVRVALEWARERGYRVIPSCWFVDAVMEGSEEYGDLRKR